MSKKIHLMIDAQILKHVLTKNACRSGIFWTALELIHAMQKRPDVQLSLYCSTININEIKKAIKYHLPELKNIPIHTHKDIFYFFKWFSYLTTLPASFYKTYWYIRFLLRRIHSNFVSSPNSNIWTKIDVFLSPIYAIPSWMNNYPKIKKWVVMYDTIPFILPEYFKDLYHIHSWFMELVNYMKTRPDAQYFAISEQTKLDFVKFIPELKSEQIFVAPLACANTFYPYSKEDTTKSLKKYNIPTDKKYVFSLCSLEPRKNLIRAVKTFVEFIKKNKIDDMVFVLGGGHWEDFIGKLDAEISDLGNYKDKIIKAGYIDDEDLAPLYSGAEWFVYTSQYEGFGLPPLEAMACGCPVITSNNSSLPEVVGDAGIMIDWDSDEQHVAAYETYYFHPELREQNRQKGLARAKEFSWDKTVDLMVEQFKNDLQES